MFTKEDIYRKYGQYDEVVSVVFKRGSMSFDSYGDSLTGVFLYTPRERRTCEDKLNSLEKSTGKVKFKEVLNKVSDEKIEYLKKNGMETDDIEYIVGNIFKNSKKFGDNNKRKLPKPSEIEVDLERINQDKLFIGNIDRLIGHGKNLTPEETDEYRGVKLNLESVNLNDVEDPKYIDTQTGSIKSSILMHYYLSRQRSKKITEDEKKHLIELNKIEYRERTEIIIRELNRAGYRSNADLNIEHQLKNFFQFFVAFREKRLTYGNPPVYLDFNRLVHIFLGHVSETKLQGNFYDKSVFQYDIDEVIRLISIVIERIKDDIDGHFSENSGKPFKRHGEMAVYWNGDYYVVHIDPSGLLMTFYKKEGRHI